MKLIFSLFSTFLICAGSIAQSSNCIDFVQNGTTLCDDFFVSNFTNPVYNGCINSAGNGNQGIYNGVSNETMNFNGANQQISIVGYGYLGQFDQMGYSVNGSAIFYLNGTFPMNVGGVTVSLDLTTPNQGGWEYYTITFSGAISTIIHESFESGITSLCSQDNAIQLECFDFLSFSNFYCGSFYLANNLTTPVYNGCVNQNFDGIYGIGNIPFNFNGSNQQITMIGYGFLGQFNQMGFSINGGSTFYLDGTFPMTIGGVTVNLDLSYPNQGGWEYYTITFTGAVSMINHEAFESGIISICAVDFQSAGIIENNLESQLTVYPNPTNDFINVECSSSIEKIEIYSMNGNLVKSINSNSKIEKIALNELNSGAYFIKAYLNDEIVHSRFVKK